jgi:hypothetical protein
MLKYDEDELNAYIETLSRDIMPYIENARRSVARAGKHFDWCCPELQQINALVEKCTNHIWQNYVIAEDISGSMRSVKAIFCDRYTARQAALSAFPNQTDDRGVQRTAASVSSQYAQMIKIPTLSSWIGGIVNNLLGKLE